MPKRKKSQIKGAPPWLVSMGDMNNLLMCFFIVMMGDINVRTQESFYLTLTSFRGSLGFMTGGKSLSKGDLPELGHNVMSLTSSERKQSLGKQTKALEQALKPDIESKYIRVSEDERGLIITLTGDVFFEPGSATIKKEMRTLLDKVARMIKLLPNFVRIEGHTDNAMITFATSKNVFKSNWDLSAARSLNVLHYFIEDADIEPKKLSAVAFGEYRPIDTNKTPEGRAYNRRIEIVILRDKFLKKSQHPEIIRPFPNEEWE